jgi:uncharacterized 2Fe-2S/4Fe-4S cluster protein (DUF4445 family)
MSAEEKSHVIDLQPIGRRVPVRAGQTLLQAAQSAEVEVQAVCGGSGTCGHCRIRLVTGQLSPPTPEERVHFGEDLLLAGWRLACQASARSDVTLDVPAESLTCEQRVQLESEAARVEVDGPKTGRGTESNEPLVGLAVDLGTTKLAGYLVNLETGETIAQHGLMNPQIAFGEDVISRISYASTSEECRQHLVKLVRGGVNKLADALCKEASIPRNRILRAVIAGNTAMHHLFAGLPVEQLGRAPYLPASTLAAQISAKQIGLELAGGANIFTPPNIAGYVGGDHVAMLLGVDIQKCESPALAIDIGTNTELTLKVNGRLLTCSCASGPAFEGAHIHQGMRAAPGAIECVHLHDGAIQFYTIDRRPPCGICGSGILDTIAVLLDAGILDTRGNLRKDQEGVRVKDGRLEFVLADARVAANGAEVTVSRQDICEIQLAKAAIRAGIDVLLEAGGVEATALKEFFLAGAFGSYLDPRSAIRIGLFPAIHMNRIQQVGNAAGLGARQMLASSTKRSEAEKLAAKIEYIELTNHPGFHEKFVKAMVF